ncbi:ribonuclease E inhibitor RraB [Sphingomonas sp. 1P06PA]|uniref:ribonuclease E inhibitor RraB n=1 Tax=Sphingomonas sp. 1P06PA TaxID=554121 RepID=UPI0039A52FA4
MSAKIDPARMEEEWAADQEVLKSLAENGDRAELVRPVDVSFRGSVEALDRLEDAAEALGFEVVDRETDDDGTLTLFLEREQAADAASIKALTTTCLEIEAEYGVEYDGWGCTAETGSTH